MTNIVAFQGERGAYSELAAHAYFGDDITAVPSESFEDVFNIVSAKHVEYGIVPIENSTHGDVEAVFDLLLRNDLSVIGEYKLPVEHALIGHPDATLDSINEIYSHPQALGQCAEFLKTQSAAIIATYDTAGSAKKIAEEQLTNAAAIASEQAADHWGLKILGSNIQDLAHNATRFFVISKEPVRKTGNKTSLIFGVKHEPGSLFSAIEELGKHNINLTKLVSRPSREKPWEYFFFLDFEGSLDNPQITESIENMKSHTMDLKILGCYEKHDG
jgi:prephenate dehydratase